MSPTIHFYESSEHNEDTCSAVFRNPIKVNGESHVCVDLFIRRGCGTKQIWGLGDLRSGDRCGSQSICHKCVRWDYAFKFVNFWREMAEEGEVKPLLLYNTGYYNIYKTSREKVTNRLCVLCHQNKQIVLLLKSYRMSASKMSLGSLQSSYCLIDRQGNIRLVWHAIIIE